MVTIDGGLDRLIRILRGSPQRSLGTPRPESAMKELHASWKWSLAFQCVVNIGVRGSEAIRTRVVEAGMVPVAIKVLGSYLRAADAMKEEEHARQSRSRRSVSARAEPQEMRRSVFPAIAAQDADVSPANTAETHGEFRELQRERSLGLPATMDSLAFGADPMFGAAPEHGRALQSAPPTNAPASPNGTEVSYGQTSREAHNGIGSDANASASASDCADETETGCEDSESRTNEADPLARVTQRILFKAERADSTPRQASAESASMRSMDVDEQGLDAARTPRAGGAPRSMERAEAAASAQEPMDEDAAQGATPPSSASDMLPVYREEEVLLSLQLLAYLSKYSHVRLFFHNADVRDDMFYCPSWPEEPLPNRSWRPSDPPKRNVFSVAERFTLRPSRSHRSSATLSSLYPRLAPEIQYWAGVVMRNACRKDESRGGIRQCANMLCDKWESYPREFAKCRRCRKAKYCSKQCQSKGWQMGHRFWCSARSEEGEKEKASSAAADSAPASGAISHASLPAEGPAPPVVGAAHTPAAATPEAAQADGSAPPVPPAATGPRENRYPPFLRPLGGRALPSTLRDASQHRLPPLRGVSTASVETNDPSDMSGDASVSDQMHNAPPGLDALGRPLPPPVIVGPASHDGESSAPLFDAERSPEQGGGIDLLGEWSTPIPAHPTFSFGAAQGETQDLGIRGLEAQGARPTASPSASAGPSSVGAALSISRMLGLHTGQRASRDISAERASQVPNEPMAERNALSPHFPTAAWSSSPSASTTAPRAASADYWSGLFAPSTHPAQECAAEHDADVSMTGAVDE